MYIGKKLLIFDILYANIVTYKQSIYAGGFVMIIGAQFFTLRDFCKTPDGLAESLEKVADIGYKSVQISGVCPYEPEWLAGQLDKNGLTCDLTHTPFDRLVKETENVIADHKTFGCKYIGIGGYNGLCEEPDVEYVKNAAKQIAPLMKKAGCLFMYHNHFTEFTKNENGKTRLVELAEKTSPDELGFTFDTYWGQYGGADLSDYAALLNGRVPCIHFKDYKIEKHEVRMAAVGDGNINFEKLAAIFENSGTEYVFVEQDNTYGEDPFDCLRRSYEYLRSIGLE